MKKLSFLLMAMLFSVMSFAAEATMAAGTNGSTCTVNGTDGIKVGTSKLGGDMTITVPAGATELSFYAGAWNKVTGLSINITPEGKLLTSSIALTADAGLSNNPPFTLAGDEASYLFTIALQNIETETTFTLTGSAAKRFVVWGATCTVGATEDFVAAPSISGDVDFVESTTVTITALEGLDVYYTIDGTDPTNESAAYTAPLELTETTTVKAVAYDGDKASAIAEKTFKQLQVLTCAEAAALCTSTESADKYVVRGYVTELIDGGYSEQYKNSTFWMADTEDGGKVLEAYAVDPIVPETDIQVKVGDYVEVIGKLKLYNTTPEFNRGSYTIIEAPVAEPTEVTVVVENMTKTIQSSGWMKQLTLDGEHETYGQVTLMASRCDGTYGTYAVTAWLGEDIELEGEGEWKNEGELDVLEVVVEDANGTVWNIIGKTDYVAPVEPVSMYADVEFTVDEEGILRVTGTTNDEVAVQLYVNGWNEVGYGTYGEGEVWGFIGDTEVANQQYTATIEQEGNVAYLHVILNDGEGNLYDLTAGGMALENPAAGAGSRTTVIVEEAEATVGIMFPEDLEIYGWSNDGREVLVTLWNGTVKKYGEYAEDFAVEVDWEQYDLVENTVATYSLEDGLAVFRAAVAAGKDTLDLVVSGTPWVDPATAEPTDTVTLAFTKGTINVSFDGTATIKGGNYDLGVQISTMGGDIYEGITSEQFNSYSSYLMIDWMQVKIHRGELKVVDLTNDVKVAYIGVLGADYKWYNITLTTADEIPTALDNINATVAPAKRINNGQLIIINNGVEYNAQGAIVK